MRAYRKWIVLIGLVIAYLFLACAGASAGIVDSGTCGEGLTWELDDEGLLTISGSGEMTGSPWDDSQIKSVVITEGVTSICYYAFHNCSSLTSITIPDSVTSIGSYAFGGCYSLTNIHIDSIESWLTISFGDYNSRPNLYGSNCHLYIGSTELTDITIPDSVISIREFAFSGCSSLMNITIPDSVTSIGNNAFYHCSSLMNITIPDSVTSIGNNAFYHCSSLTSIAIPASVKSIEYDAFSGCSSLTGITLPDSVISIGESAFYGCDSLTSIVIPASVISIGYDAFYDCSNLTDIHIDSIESWLKIKYSNSYSHPNLGKPNCHLFIGNMELTGIVIPDSVTSIGECAFFGFSSLTSITIPDSVTSIGNAAFYNCTSLTSITIPDSVTSIGNDAFYNCSNLVSVVIGNSVTSIGNDAFSGCSSLMSITIPDSVTSIGKNAFGDCYSLANIHIGSIESWLTISYSDYSSRPNLYESNCHLYIGSTELTDVTIPDNIKNIGEYAFENCSSLTSITIPDSVTSIGGGAFYGCSSLMSITIPDSVTSIGSSAFSGCSSLTGITIPDSVTSIGAGTFRNCYCLTSIVIPDSVTSIGNAAFYHCTSLTSITIPDSVVSIGESAFSECFKLSSITIPDSVTKIEDNAFNYCAILRKVLFTVSDPDKNISFGDNMFYFYTPPTIYCHMFTAPHIYFAKLGYNVVFIEDIEDMDSIRTITLPDDFRMACGDSRTLACAVFPGDGEPVTWTSSNPDVLTVLDGIVTAVAPGTATVTAAIGTVSDTVTIETYQPATGLVLNETAFWLQAAREGVQLSVAAYTPENASAELTWSSSDITLATVDENGYVTTFKPGEVTITATTERGVTASCTLHLTWPVTSLTMSPASASIYAEETLQLTATAVTSRETFENKLVTFASGDESIATVDASGIVTGVSPGTVTITASTVNGKTASAVITVLCTNHVPVIDEAVAPSCTEPGLSEGSHCKVCGAVIVPQEELPALGHDWGPAFYTWSDNHSEVTAVRVCTRDEEHVETETVPATGEATKEPTCAVKGETTYTSDPFENEAFSIQTITLDNIDKLPHTPVTDDAVPATCLSPGLTEGSHCSVCNETLVEQVEIPAKGHDWNTSYEWAEDYSAVTATCVCRNDESHTGTETAAVTAAILSPTDDNKGAVIYTSGEFTHEAFTVQTKRIDIPALKDMSVLWLPTDLTVVADEAFDSILSEAAIIPAGCTYIGSHAFRNCRNLIYVRVPAGCVIAPNAFEGSDSVLIDRVTE